MNSALLKQLEDAKTPEAEKEALAAAKSWLLETDAKKYEGVGKQIDAAVTPPLVTEAVKSVQQYIREHEIEAPNREEQDSSPDKIIHQLSTAKTPEEQKVSLAAAKEWLLKTDATKYAGMASQIDLALTPPLVTEAIRSTQDYLRNIKAPDKANEPAMSDPTRNGQRSP